MSLDNHKCWKSKVNVWLRGDRKPYSFRTSIVAGLSTREYVRNVFLQNHSWTMMWRRKLGSTFTCVQRCSLLWTSITLGMFASNYLVYRWPYGEQEQIDADTGLRVPIEKILRGDDAVSAGVLGALIGALLGMFLRSLIKLMTPTRKWSRVDEKGDFTHLMSPEDLIFAEGAVVTASKPRYQGPKIPPFPPCVDSDVLKILDSLTPKQIETVKAIVNSDKYNLEDSPPDNVREHSKDTRTSSDKKSRLGDVVSRATKSSNGRKNDKSSLWKRAKDPSSAYRGADTSSQSSTNRGLKYPNPRAAVEDLTTTDDNSDVESIRPTKYISARDSKTSDANNNDKVPQISARFSDTTVASTATNKRDYDSLSEGESDVEAVTKRLKAPYEVNNKRRAQNVYDTAPWWDDRHKVYVSAPDAGDDHHRAVNERYERTAATETGCCRVRVESTFGEDAVLNYLEIENELPPGGVRGTFNVVAIIVSGLAFAASVAVPPFIVYQRLPLPDPYALYYLYSVILCLAFHAFVFCTADAAFCTLLATVTRRRKVAKAQKKAKLSAMLRNKN